MTSKPRVTADDPSDLSWAEWAVAMAGTTGGLGLIGAALGWRWL